jgi:Ca-activated chloride channel family protein
VVSPLTNDTEAVASLVDSLVTGEVGQPGSDIGSALIGAMRIVEGDPALKPDLVLISDGEDQGSRLGEAIQRAKTLGFRVSTVVIGSTDGSQIPAGEGVLRDSSGETVVSYARPDVMARIASETGGQALVNPFGESSLEALADGSGSSGPRQTHARQPLDRYQWPLAASLILLLGASVVHRGAE